MKNTEFNLPKKYWFYFANVILFGIISIVNIFVFDYLTGEKEFRDYNASDIKLNLIFLGTELMYWAIAAFFALKGRTMIRKNTLLQLNYWFDSMYTGIQPDDYDHVWFDAQDEQRALILNQDSSWQLHVEKFNYSLARWEAVNTVSVFDSLETLKKALYSEFAFYCYENSFYSGADEDEDEKVENPVNERLNTYDTSDSLLLLAIDFNKDASTLASIMKYAFDLTHTKLTLDELNYGMSKLTQNGYVKKSLGYYKTTKKADSFLKLYKDLIGNPTDDICRFTDLLQYESKKTNCSLENYFNENDYNQCLE